MTICSMRRNLLRTSTRLLVPLLLAASLLAQAKHIWVLRPTGEMVEYDAATFAVKQRVKVPPEAVKSAANIQVNSLGQILWAPTVSLPLSDDDVKSAHKIWLWDGHAASTIDQPVSHKEEKIGSNEAELESAPAAYLSADGKHLFWFANQTRRLQRESVDLSIDTTWQAWQTDLSGAAREDIASTKFPDCRCKTGTCEDTCPSGVVWSPAVGIGEFFLMTQFVQGQTAPTYKASARYSEDNGKWTSTDLPEPLQRVLDATADGKTIVEAIPDTGCCGWSNQSDDQTLVLADGKKITAFDEQATYKNADYDVTFYTANARLSPQVDEIAMTIAATSLANKPIQLAEQGQANPEESAHIRKSLSELPAVVVKSVDESPSEIAFIPHAALVGWLSDKKLLILQDHLLLEYNIATKARRRTTIRVDDATRAFLR